MFLNFYVTVFMACNIIYGTVLWFYRSELPRYEVKYNKKACILSFTVNKP